MLHLLRCHFGRDKAYYRLVREWFGIRPRNIELYKLALMHRSASVDLHGRHLNNERLEFLGDAIIEAIVSDFLFIEFPDENEGGLTRLRSRIVSRTTLNTIAQALGIDNYIVKQTGGSAVQKHILGDALEAMIGAMYLDLGYNVANRTLIGLMHTHIDLESLVTHENDYKSRLIECCQKSRQQVRFSTGHDEKYTSQLPVFRAVVMIDGIEVGHGIGETKKEAEQTAAHVVWEALSDKSGDKFLENIDSYEATH
ncbi:MAG: ribonuclease III [Alistipes sp.]|jgi:ribonuclease-3|nr:ribonuclease III [Alistipes sp.]